MEVQVFGVKKSADTRKALRFFAERRVKTHFVDFLDRGPSLGELKRFEQKFGITAMLDKESHRYTELGLQHSRYADETWLQRFTEEPMLLKMPLVRQVGGGNGMTIGAAESVWKEWAAR